MPLSQEKPLIYTIGSSTREIREFMEVLSTYQIQSLVDVRRFPTSRFEHFKKEQLAQTLEQAQIEYAHLGKELGGYRKEGYPSYLNTLEFQKGRKRLEEIALRKTTVIMCSERFPWKCHRRFIAKELQKRGWQVIHLLEKGKVWEDKADGEQKN